MPGTHPWMAAPRRVVVASAPEHTLEGFLFACGLAEIRRKQMRDRAARDASIEIDEQWCENRVATELIVGCLRCWRQILRHVRDAITGSIPTTELFFTALRSRAE